ncbi:MAG: hypothetical protein ACKV22_19840 [Bryobacteraceae bacterium]
MTRTKKQPKDATSGFAIRLKDDTDLGNATLIAEDETGGYLPLCPVATIAEGREIAQGDQQLRMRELERGGEPFCPTVYRVWARGVGGSYAVAAEFDPSKL